MGTTFKTNLLKYGEVQKNNFYQTVPIHPKVVHAPKTATATASYEYLT